jgi:hypothetical protein
LKKPLKDPETEAGQTPGRSNRIRELQEQIADLKKRWPAHSTPPAMLQQLDDLEEELEQELRNQKSA